ncbi:hypothetical protein BB560_004444 [Smittium megazygosporum]|uniref:WD repeat-containing protein JIP5 n=1 Tax=Smittium megazygosporum TaxID=133381 RepID=A0A2T9Z9E5_9FUNG|nr:hypothetical protein BB560_004444 [Smittium megazygosporum]
MNKDTESLPRPLRFTEQIFDISLHPSKHLLASGLLTGHVFVHSFGTEKNHRLFRERLFKKSCRAVSFSIDGQASKDKSWKYLDLNTKKVTFDQENAHSAPLNKLISLNEQMIATGDDNGAIWDIRQKKQAFSYNEHVDFISSFTFNEPKRHLFATSGDGCLSVYDVRKSKTIAVSENQDDELTSSVVIRNGSKLAVGTQSGTVGIFSYGLFSDVTDRILGNTSSIESMCKISESRVVTAGDDGFLRVLDFFPHKYSIVLGKHGVLPMEKIVKTFDEKYLVSCGQDSKIKFWDISGLKKTEARIREDYSDSSDESDEPSGSDGSGSINSTDDDNSDDEDKEKIILENNNQKGRQIRNDLGKGLPSPVDNKKKNNSESSSSSNFGSDSSDDADTRTVKSKGPKKREILESKTKNNGRKNKKRSFFSDL